MTENKDKHKEKDIKKKSTTTIVAAPTSANATTVASPTTSKEAAGTNVAAAAVSDTIDNKDHEKDKNQQQQLQQPDRKSKLAKKLLGSTSFSMVVHEAKRNAFKHSMPQQPQSIGNTTSLMVPTIQPPSPPSLTTAMPVTGTPTSVSPNAQPLKRTHLGDELVQQQQQQQQEPFYRTASGSFRSEILLLDLDTGDVCDLSERLATATAPVTLRDKDEFGTQRVYKKTSPNCVLTLYLPSREITLAGTTPSILRGIVYVDPKAAQGYRIYAQLTLTFRYGREDEEVMGLRFCNEAIMSLHQVWPRNEEPARESLSPLQEALVKRLGDGAHPFTLSLTSQAPPSVQLVPAKRYYGAPIGTSYDVRCFIADKTDDKFHRRASVKMGVRVIYRTDVFHHHANNGPENFAALINSQTASPPLTAVGVVTTPPAPPAILDATGNENSSTQHATTEAGSSTSTTSGGGVDQQQQPQRVGSAGKSRKSDRGESFPKIRLSPKAFRFSGRFGRSKSEIEKCPSDPFYNYSKSFQEYESCCGSGGGPQGAVDKPFLLQDGRVGLRASLDKAWYTHGEDIAVTVNIRNDSRKTVRKIRVCAIQHVDVCMFNNGKFKNVVADTDTNSPMDRTVAPGSTFHTTIVLKPQRGPTKNWIALEDTLQRSTEPDEITGAIAASAIRSPNFVLPMGHPLNMSASPAVGIPHPNVHQSSSNSASTATGSGGNEDRNVFAIYVSYYVKVKLTLSGMGGELSLKLPFVLVHVDESQRALHTAAVAAAGVGGGMEKLALDEVPANRKNGNKIKIQQQQQQQQQATNGAEAPFDRIESADDELNLQVPTTNASNGVKRRLLRSETIAKDLDDETADHIETITEESNKNTTTLAVNKKQPHQSESLTTSSVELEHVHVVQIHSVAPSSEQPPPPGESPAAEQQKSAETMTKGSSTDGAATAQHSNAIV